jgi:glutamine amidotransferase
MGNVESIRNMLKRVGVRALVSADPKAIAEADKIILPGVGAFDSAMQRIRAGRLREVLDRKVLIDRVPVLGICLGMQLMTRSSEEGTEEGLNWLAASSIRFPTDVGLKVPHMGWNAVVKNCESPITRDLPADARFYFVHSYYVSVDDDADSILKANYGVQFDAAIAHGNIFGVQFHPEKSHRFGMQLLESFSGI